MKAIVNGLYVLAAAALFVWASPQAAAQTGAPERGRLRLDSLDGLQSRASEHVVVDVDAGLLRLATAVLSEEEADEREVKQLVVGLRGVFVRSYEFTSEKQYADADLAAIRAQLRAPGWSRIVDVKAGAGGSENVELYLAAGGGRVEGLALLSAEPKKVTVVNIVGSIDLEKLRKLEGNLGIPKLRIERKAGGATAGEERGKTKRP
jgi:hypothetical protein